MSELQLNTEGIFGKYANGTLDFIIAENPSIDLDSESLNISIDDSNFDAIRIDALKSKDINFEIPTDRQNVLVPIEEVTKLFQKNFPEFKFLGRHYHMSIPSPIFFRANWATIFCGRSFDNIQYTDAILPFLD